MLEIRGGTAEYPRQRSLEGTQEQVLALAVCGGAVEPFSGVAARSDAN